MGTIFVEPEQQRASPKTDYQAYLLACRDEHCVNWSCFLDLPNICCCCDYTPMKSPYPLLSTPTYAILFTQIAYPACNLLPLRR